MPLPWKHFLPCATCWTIYQLSFTYGVTYRVTYCKVVLQIEEATQVSASAIFFFFWPAWKLTSKQGFTFSIDRHVLWFIITFNILYSQYVLTSLLCPLCVWGISVSAVHHSTLVFSEWCTELRVFSAEEGDVSDTCLPENTRRSGESEQVLLGVCAAREAL